MSIRAASHLNVNRVILLVGLLVSFNSCTDSTVDPGPGPVIVKNYQLITVIKEVEGDFLTFFDVPADTVLDTTNIGSNFNELAITPDLSRVFVSSQIQNKTIVYSVDSMSIDTTLPWHGTYYFDELRNIGVRVNSSGFNSFNMNTYAPGISVTKSIGASGIDVSGEVLYVSSISEQISFEVYRYNYSSGALIDSFLIKDSAGANLFVTEMLPLPESNRLYLYVENNSGAYAVVYDTQLGKIVNQVSHRVPIGKFLKNSDASLVYKSDPDLSSVLTSGKIWQYNVSSDMIVSNLSTVVNTTNGNVTVSVTPMVFTPDGRFMYSSGTTVSLLDGVLLKHSLSLTKKLSCPKNIPKSLWSMLKVMDT